jgi:hypothetical protein
MNIVYIFTVEFLFPPAKDKGSFVMKPVLTVLLCLTLLACAPAPRHSALEKGVGDRTPIFSAASSLDTLVSYDRDYYGKHHLVLTFFPAAYTPV